MTEQQMPARIWVNPIAIVSPDIYFPNAVMTNGNENIKSGDVSFIRADLAERIAEALSDTATLLKSFSTPDDATAKYILDMADSALSAFRSATQDTEARHD